MSTSKTRELKCESLALMRDYQQSPSVALRNEIVKLNMGLVRKEAHHWTSRCHESYDDLLQVGCLGLIRAIDRFDASRGHAFSSFAIPYIRGEIQHYLRDKSSSVRIPRRWLELRQQARSLTQRLRAELHRQPTDAELAEALGISIAEWQDVQLAHQNRELISLDLTVGDADNGSTSLGDLVLDRRYYSFQLAQEDRIRIQQALIQLEQRTRDVLEFVFLHDLTHKEVADLLDISVVTVSRRIKKGLDTLKSVMLKG